LKLYAWEPSFIKQISDVRDKELSILWRMSLWGAFMMLFWTVAPYAVSNIIPYFTGYKAILFFLTLTPAPIIVLHLFYVLKPMLPLLIIKT
jgi:ATP-binding cassette subfamily C (CFTR/MRP) protein 1